jgi:uroporphyrinogen III methyltransferase/synthase
MTLASVLVTRPPPGGSELAALLQAEGIPALFFPTVEIAAPEDSRPLRAVAARATRDDFDWIVFTSANGVRSFARELAALEMGPRVPRARIAAVGAATAAAASSEGWSVELVPDAHTSEGLLDALSRDRSLERAKVLLPVAERARDVLPAGLRALGAEVELVVAYRTLTRASRELDDLRSLVRGQGVHLVTFASPSAAESFLEGLGDDALALPAVAIGPVTAEAAQGLGYQVVAVANPHTNAGLVQAVKGWLAAGGLLGPQLEDLVPE